MGIDHDAEIESQDRIGRDSFGELSIYQVSILFSLLREQTFCNSDFRSVWRPLRVPVKDWPLALCDPKSVDPASLQDGDVVFEDFVIENKLLHHHQNHAWYYASDQRPDEVWAFLQADSRSDGLAGKSRS